MRNFLIFIGIILVGWLAISDTLSHFKEVSNLSIITPAQQEMRQPSRQNPGQRSVDIQTERIRNNTDTNTHYDTNPNNNSNRFDNFNRNRTRTQNKLRDNNNNNNNLYNMFRN